MREPNGLLDARTFRACLASVDNYIDYVGYAGFFDGTLMNIVSPRNQGKTCSEGAYAKR